MMWDKGNILDQKDWPKGRTGGYADGDYTCICRICGGHFIGDKRAIHCYLCAVAAEKIEAEEKNSKSDWLKLNIEAWDTERGVWCRVTDLDVDGNKIGLSNGCVHFWRDLDKIKLRCNQGL